MADELNVRKHGYYGIDFVQVGSCRLEKRKLGPLTIGGCNVLVLRDLSVVLPTDSRPEADGAGAGELTAMALADRFGITRELSGLRNAPFKFSGLRIEGLRLATLDAATNVCPCLMAETGEARRDGLHLRECVVVRGGKTNAVGRAVLHIKPDLRLTWADGEMKI